MANGNLFPDQPGYQSVEQPLIQPLDLETDEERLAREERERHNIEQQLNAEVISTITNLPVTPGIADKVGRLTRGVGGFLQGVADTPKNLTLSLIHI